MANSAGRSKYNNRDRNSNYNRNGMNGSGGGMMGNGSGGGRREMHNRPPIPKRPHSGGSSMANNYPSKDHFNSNNIIVNDSSYGAEKNTSEREKDRDDSMRGAKRSRFSDAPPAPYSNATNNSRFDDNSRGFRSNTNNTKFDSRKPPPSAENSRFSNNPQNNRYRFSSGDNNYRYTNKDDNTNGSAGPSNTTNTPLPYDNRNSQYFRPPPPPADGNFPPKFDSKVPPSSTAASESNPRSYPTTDYGKNYYLPPPNMFSFPPPPLPAK